MRNISHIMFTKGDNCDARNVDILSAANVGVNMGSNRHHTKAIRKNTCATSVQTPSNAASVETAN